MCTLAFLELVNEGNIQAQVDALYLHHTHQDTSLISLCSLDDSDFILWQIRGTVILNDLQGAGPQASKKRKIWKFLMVNE